MTKSLFIKRFLLVLGVAAVLTAAGTVGFMQFPEYSVADALYMTVITLSAVGYQEVHPLTGAGRTLAGVLLVGGITTMGMWFALITSALVEMDLGEVFRNRQIMKRIDALSDHVIVCGAGRTGQQVVRELAAADVPYLVIEWDPDRAEEVRELDGDALVLEEDATRDETLEEAGIDTARGLVAALSADTDNLFVCLTARDRNPQLEIVARALDEESMSKLYKAGADHCVSPNITGGVRMASMLIRPEVMSFLDVVTGVGEMPLRLEEVEVPGSSQLAGHTLAEAAIPQKTGLIVIAISHREAHEEGRLVYNPGPDEEITPGDVLIVLGPEEQVEGLRAIVAP
jgi:voltage-gated potassium channel